MSFQFSADKPYPEIQIEEQNKQYACAMLSNVGDCSSEMSAVSMYFYNSVIAKDQYPEIAQCFHKISVVEMHHLHIFARIAWLLGADPRLWCCSRGRTNYWSASSNPYTGHILTMLENAIYGEQETIEKYQMQMEYIKDENIVANLLRIIEDEKIHIEIFHDLYGMISER